MRNWNSPLLNPQPEGDGHKPNADKKGVMTFSCGHTLIPDTLSGTAAGFKYPDQFLEWFGKEYPNEPFPCPRCARLMLTQAIRKAAVISRATRTGPNAKYQQPMSLRTRKVTFEELLTPDDKKWLAGMLIGY